jgi:hypothetical protein
MASKLAVRTAAVRARYKERERDVVGSAVGVTTGLTIGAMENKGALPISVLGLPTKLGLGILGLGVSMFAPGRFGHVIRRAADASLTCYGYNAGRTGAVVAGMDDFVSGDDDDDTEDVS